MAGIIVRSKWPLFMTPGGLNSIRKRQWESGENELEEQRSEIYKVDTTDDPFYQDYGTVGMGPAVRKPETTPKRLDEPRMGRPFTLVFPTYALAVAISREAQEDDKRNVLVPMIARELKLSMKETKERDAFNQLLYGFDYQGWETDGQPLFSTAHPLLRNQDGGLPGTSSNRHPTDAALSISSLDAAYTALRQTRNDTGRYLTELTPVELWVSPQLYPYAMQIVGTKQTLGSNNNDKNNYYGAFTVKMSPRLSDFPQQWYLTAGKNKSGFIWMDRAPEDYDTDVDKIADVTVLMTRARWGRGAKDWRGWFGSRGPV